MRVTLRDIAKSLNLSHTTVSRALSAREDPFISEATRQRVRVTAQKMGYRPNQVARALVTGRTHIVAFWVSYLASPHTARAIQYVQRQLKQERFEMFVQEAYLRNEVRTDGTRLSDWPVDGVIALDCQGYTNAFLDAHPAFHSPIISVGHYYVDRVDYVGVDLYSGALEAVRHLVTVTGGRIAYCVPQWANQADDGRYDAYLSVIRQAGSSPEVIIDPSGSRAGTRERVRDYVREQGCPGGLFCYNDDMAIGAYRALRDLGLRVPDDVALVGCDGIEETEYLECPISTIIQPIEQMCSLAWEFLQQRMKDPSTPLQKALLQPQLEIRESSRRPGGSIDGSGVAHSGRDLFRDARSSIRSKPQLERR